jgi:hypothetical protein
MMSLANPMAVSSLRQGPPARRELASDAFIGLIFGQGAVRASARQLRGFPSDAYISDLTS